MIYTLYLFKVKLEQSCLVWCRNRIATRFLFFLLFSITFKRTLIYLRCEVQWPLWCSKECGEYLSVAFITKVDVSEMALVWELMHCSSW